MPGGCASRFAAALIPAMSSSCGSSFAVSSIDGRGPRCGVGVVSDPPGAGVPSTEWATEPASVPASALECLRSHAATLFSHSSFALGNPSSARIFSSFRRSSCLSTSSVVWSRHTVRLMSFYVGVSSQDDIATRRSSLTIIVNLLYGNNVGMRLKKLSLYSPSRIAFRATLTNTGLREGGNLPLTSQFSAAK